MTSKRKAQHMHRGGDPTSMFSNNPSDTDDSLKNQIVKSLQDLATNLKNWETSANSQISQIQSKQIDDNDDAKHEHSKVIVKTAIRFLKQFYAIQYNMMFINSHIMNKINYYNGLHPTNSINVDDLYEKAKSSLDKFLKNVNITRNYSDTDIQEEANQLIEEWNAYTNKMVEKIKKLYTNKVSMIDVILDKSFLMLYVLKIISFIFLLISLQIAERLFMHQYMDAVYGNGRSPPNILNFVGIMLGFSLMFLIFTVTILALAMYVLKHLGTKAGGFLINIDLIKKFLMDHLVTIVITVLFSIILGMIIQRKRYFRYKTEGQRGVRALKEMIMGIGVIVFLIPYFAFF